MQVMVGYTKNILLASGSISQCRLLVEIFSQLERRIRVDLVPEETEVIPYLIKHAPKRLPGLIVFARLQLKTEIVRVVGAIRNNQVSSHIPIVFFLPSPELVVMREWVKANAVFFYPQPVKPSDIKFFLRQMVEHYAEARRLKKS